MAPGQRRETVCSSDSAPARRVSGTWITISPTRSAPTLIPGLMMPRSSSWTAAAPGKPLPSGDGNNGRIEHVQTINWPNSLGLFYAEFTEFLGFTPNADEWKVMGLAPYGKPGVDLSCFLDPEADPYKVHTDRLTGKVERPYSGWPTCARLASRTGKRHQRPSQRYRLCRSGLVRNRDDERRSAGPGENAQQKSVPGWRRRAQFQSQRQNCCLWHRRQHFCPACRFR